MKKAFTLIELLVVIAIIGILSVVLFSSLSGYSEKTISLKCQTNLKNLAVAVNSYSMCGHYPYAQSALYITTSGSAENETGSVYYQHKGWLSWIDRDTRYPLQSPSAFQQPSLSMESIEDRMYAITNGAIWMAVGKNRDCYICPACFNKKKKNANTIGWSYQMNAYFGYEKESGKALATVGSVIETGQLPRADRILLFAEIQSGNIAKPSGDAQDESTTDESADSEGKGAEETDGCLLYKSKGGNEGIGFNHRRGRKYVGHVVFADGHVETLEAPSEDNIAEITDLLCRGRDYIYSGGRYRDADSVTDE